MKSLIVYDSTFGNTKTIAEIIAKEIGRGAKAIYVGDVKKEMLKGLNLLVVGCPIIAWKPSPKTAEFLESLSEGELKGTKAASFDTRVKIFIHGDATKKVSIALKEKGAEIISKPQFFFVKGTEGPLLDGEKEKAAQWAKSLIA